jgi:hypothetical protein
MEGYASRFILSGERCSLLVVVKSQLTHFFAFSPSSRCANWAIEPAPDAPNVAGHTGPYIAAQPQAYESGARKNGAMSMVAPSWTRTSRTLQPLSAKEMKVVKHPGRIAGVSDGRLFRGPDPLLASLDECPLLSEEWTSSSRGAQSAFKQVVR